MIIMADRHDNKELPIFRLFASVCGLLIEPGSIEKRAPPEPDILCVVTGEGPVAFEMVELIDRQKIAKPTGDQYELMDHFRDGRKKLPAEARAVLEAHFGNAWVQARLRPDVSLRRRKQIADRIIDEMLKLDADFEGTFPMNEGRMEVASVEVRRRDGIRGGPHFRVLAAASFNAIPLDKLAEQLAKSYCSLPPVEL